MSSKDGRRGRRGVAGLVSGIIIFAILFGTIAAYFSNIWQLDNFVSAVEMERARTDRNEALEDIRLTPTLTVAENLALDIENRGPYSIKIVELFVGYFDGAHIAQGASWLPLALNSREDANTLDTGVAYDTGSEYIIKVVTERGTVAAVKYPEEVPRYVRQAEASGSITVDFANFKWMRTAGGLHSGQLVGGYPAFAVPTGTYLVFVVKFVNRDPLGRSVTLYPTSVITTILLTDQSSTQHERWFIAEGLASPPVQGQVSAYNSTQPFVTLPIDEEVTLYFGARDPFSSTSESTASNTGPAMSILSLFGTYSDDTLYGQTIPFLASYTTDATIGSMSPEVGGTSQTVQISGSGFLPNKRGYVGWINPSTGRQTILNTFTTSASGATGTVSFTVPSAPAGYYTIVLSDFANSAFRTFQHT